MKRLFIICVLLTLLVYPCEAQQKMKDVFLQMPDRLLPSLTESNKLDFIDFLDSNMKAVVTNKLDGKSEMLSLDDESLAIQVSSSMQMSMRLMPVNEPIDSCLQVVCVITTYGKDAPESKIDVYSLKWRLLNVATHLQLPPDPYVAEFVPSSTTLVLKETKTLDAIVEDEQEETIPWLKNIEWKP